MDMISRKGDDGLGGKYFETRDQARDGGIPAGRKTHTLSPPRPKKTGADAMIGIAVTGLA
jgi:hypothetical protein